MQRCHNTLVLQGPVPAYDRGTLVSLSAALASNTEEISSIRCFSVHWDALPEEFLEWFGAPFQVQNDTSFPTTILDLCNHAEFGQHWRVAQRLRALAY